LRPLARAAGDLDFWWIVSDLDGNGKVAAMSLLTAGPFGTVRIMVRAGRAGRLAFTLIELLVVIATIAVLLGILLPSLAGARQSARTVHCASNLRTIGQVLATYADDNKSWHPYTSEWQVWGGDGTFPDEPGLGWPELLQNYMSTREVYVDKARPDAPMAYFLQSRYARWLLAQAGGTPDPMRPLATHLPTVVFASQFVLGGDCMSRGFFSLPYGPASRAPNCDFDDGEAECAFLAGALVPHQGAVNLLYGDNHVAASKGYERGRMTWHGREMRSWGEMQ